MKKIIAILLAFMVVKTVAAQQVLTMQEIQSAIQTNHPALKMLDAEARSMNEEAKGAYSWMPPEVGAGFFQTPYDPGRWKYMNGQPGMGAFMISAQQMFPNKKAECRVCYMNAQSSVELQKDVIVNELVYSKKTIMTGLCLERNLKCWTKMISC